MNFQFIITIALLFTLTQAAIVKPLEQDCVLGNDGHQICTLSAEISDVQSASRMARRKSTTCQRKDVMCWCKKALEYTNNVRKKKGLSMLTLGSKMQMANAMRYAKKLSNMGYLKHQNLHSVTKEVGCKHWVGGENLAFNYESGDIARKCVDQWIKSKGHYANLVRPWFKEMVVGFKFDKDGRVYCVQTFSLYSPTNTYGRRNAPKCKPVS